MDETSVLLAPHQRVWLAAFDDYAARHPEEHASAALFRSFVAAYADAAERHLAIGHLTGAAWLVSADGARVLLTHHKKLNRWLQLGGHADGDVDLARVALREAEEESGLRDLVIEPAIFDLDRHQIPAHGRDIAHWHYDVRYIVRVTSSEAFAVSDESHALAWCEIAAIARDPAMDASLRRMAQKYLARGA